MTVSPPPTSGTIQKWGLLNGEGWLTGMAESAPAVTLDCIHRPPPVHVTASSD